jgi:hypothetical protein
MKKIISFLMVSCLLFMAQSVTAQVVNIPGAAKEHFLKTYPANTEADWSNNVTNYTVKFKNDGKTMRGHYRMDGTWDFTETMMTNEQLPADIKASLSKSRYSDWELQTVTKVNNDNKQELYRVEVKKGSQKQFIFYDITGKEVKSSMKF